MDKVEIALAVIVVVGLFALPIARRFARKTETKIDDEIVESLEETVESIRDKKKM